MYERQVHPCFIRSMNAWNDYVRGEQIVVELFTGDLVKETGKLLFIPKALISLTEHMEKNRNG